MKQTFLYAVCGVILITAFSGCAGINALLKSGQPDLIYSKALEYYQKEKWSRASTLFEGVQHYYSGTPREDSISFFNARCKYKNRDFDTASTLLDDFRLSGYARSHVWNTFVSDGVSQRVRVPRNLVYGGSVGFFF